jgi:hypothetical protein
MQCTGLTVLTSRYVVRTYKTQLNAAVFLFTLHVIVELKCLHYLNIVKLNNTRFVGLESGIGE